MPVNNFAIMTAMNESAIMAALRTHGEQDCYSLQTATKLQHTVLMRALCALEKKSLIRWRWQRPFASAPYIQRRVFSLAQ